MELSADHVRAIALWLRPESIGRWCRVAKRFDRLIGKSPDFWMLKLQRDYPKAKARPPDARNRYRTLYATDRIRELNESNDGWRSDPAAAALLDERASIKSDIDTYFQRQTRSTGARFDELDERSKCVEDKLNDLRTDFERKLEDEKQRQIDLRARARMSLPRGKGRCVRVVLPYAAYAEIIACACRKEGEEAKQLLLRFDRPIDHRDYVFVREDCSSAHLFLYFYRLKNAKLAVYGITDSRGDRCAYPRVMLRREGPPYYIAWKYGLEEWVL